MPLLQGLVREASLIPRALPWAHTVAIIASLPAIVKSCVSAAEQWLCLRQGAILSSSSENRCSLPMKLNLEQLQFDQHGLLPVIVQHAETGEVLTLAYMNRESLNKTLDTGETWFFSRSRQQLWHKGESSGNVQRLVSIKFDCDADALLLQVLPAGPACHTGARTCFHRLLDDNKPTALPLPQILAELQEVIQQRRRDLPEGSYTAALFRKGIKKIAQKVGEEAVEVAIASVHESDDHLAAETADLLYHLLVLLVARQVPLQQIIQKLAERRG